MVRGSAVKESWLRRGCRVPWSPKAEKAELIIYCTISGMRVDAKAGLGTKCEVVGNGAKLEAPMEV